MKIIKTAKFNKISQENYLGVSDSLIDSLVGDEDKLRRLQDLIQMQSGWNNNNIPQIKEEIAKTEKGISTLRDGLKLLGFTDERIEESKQQYSAKNPDKYKCMQCGRDLDNDSDTCFRCQERNNPQQLSDFT
jgi:hypothetical protein